MVKQLNNQEAKQEPLELDITTSDRYLLQYVGSMLRAVGWYCVPTLPAIDVTLSVVSVHAGVTRECHLGVRNMGQQPVAEAVISGTQDVHANGSSVVSNVAVQMKNGIESAGRKIVELSADAREPYSPDVEGDQSLVSAHIYEATVEDGDHVSASSNEQQGKSVRFFKDFAQRAKTTNPDETMAGKHKRAEPQDQGKDLHANGAVNGQSNSADEDSDSQVKKTKASLFKGFMKRKGSGHTNSVSTDGDIADAPASETSGDSAASVKENGSSENVPPEQKKAGLFSGSKFGSRMLAKSGGKKDSPASLNTNNTDTTQVPSTDGDATPHQSATSNHSSKQVKSLASRAKSLTNIKSWKTTKKTKDQDITTPEIIAEAQGLCGTSSGSTAGDVADDTAPVTDQHLHLAPAADVSTASQPEPVPPADMAVAIATPDQDADVTATAKDQGADLATVSTDHVVPDADVSKAADETEDADVGSHDKDVVTDVHGAAELQPARRVSSYEIEEIDSEALHDASPSASRAEFTHATAQEQQPDELQPPEAEEFAPAQHDDGDFKRASTQLGEVKKIEEAQKGLFGLLGRARKGLFGVDKEDQVKAEQAAAAATAAAAAAEQAAAEAAAAEAAANPPEPEKEPSIRKFPRGFMWGSATSAYQIEGAWMDEGKGMSIWDAFTHSQGRVFGGGNADISCCHYYRYREDVALMKGMGLKYYRLSISWARIFPNGKGKVNDRGVAFYDRLINELIANKIMPVVTLYHWDLPLGLQLEEDGWLNPKIVDHFVKFAKLCFTRFGDRVKYWITFNEPWCSAVLGHDSGGQHAPGRTVDPSKEVYKVAHHMLLAHAKAYNVYQKLFKRKQRGKVGMSLQGDWYEAKPAADPEEARRNVKAAERALEFTIGWFARPLYQGDYPTVMRERVGNRLPRFTREQRAMLKGSIDFFGLNHYSSHLCEQPIWYKELAPQEEPNERETKLRKVAQQLTDVMTKVSQGFGHKANSSSSGSEIQEGEIKEPVESPKVQVLDDDEEPPEDPYIESTGYWQDISVDQTDDDAWKITDMGWGIHPEGIRKMLDYIQREYNPRGGIIITENGVAVREGELDDSLKDIDRAVYIKNYLREVHKAILTDDVDVRGYFVWSLLDNFEWGYGYTKKFGLHHVDLNTLERTPKLSANFFTEVIKKNRLEMV
eukprot:jgi/Chrzof1/3425/Cz12g24240.t1